jgi:hypothetical protein
LKARISISREAQSHLQRGAHPEYQQKLNAALNSLRLCVEHTFTWEDRFKRLLLRFEFKQQRYHYGMKFMAYTP